MINIKHLELQKFLSHVNTSIDFKDYEGLILIEGINTLGQYSSNGSGKSTLLEGIIYALTGNTLRGVSVNDVVNRNYKKNTKVSLKFNKDEHDYEVHRYRKDDNFGDSLILYKDNENVSKRVNKETQKSLEDILGISYDVLVSTVLLGEGLSSRFTQLSDPEKKNLIESTLNLNYDISSIRAKANSNLSQLNLKLSNLEGRLSTLKELSNLDIGECQKLIKEYEDYSAKASKMIEGTRARISEIQASRESLDSKLNLLRSSITQVNNLESELRRLDEEVLVYVHELDKLESSECPHCALCNQELSSEESKDSVRSNYQEKITNIHSRMLEVQSTIEKLPSKELLEEKYSLLSSELANINSEYDKYNTLLLGYYEDYNKYSYEVKRINSDIVKYEENISDISIVEKEHEDITRDIRVYKYFYELFSPTGIIVNILAEAVNYINNRLAVYSDVLLEKEYRINFIKGKISLVDRDGASYQSLSNGEKRRLDLSLQFALHDYVHTYCGMKVDCCFIDEILDTLDDVGVDNIFEVLRLKLDYCKLKSIYVITHNDALKDKFDQVITIKKELNGDSFLV